MGQYTITQLIFIKQIISSKKGELEDAILNVIGILHSYNLEDFGA